MRHTTGGGGDGGPYANQRRRFFGRRHAETRLDMLCAIGFDGTVRAANPASRDLLGYEEEDVLRVPATRFVHPADAEVARLLVTRLARGDAARVAFEARCRASDGSWHWLALSACAAQDERMIYMSARDISAQKAREAELEHAALVDSLTGLPNRRAFDQGFERQLAAAERYGQHPALIVFDLDSFKAYNDRFGHQMGDALLREVAAVLRSSLRKSDLPARLGGDEFAVLLPDCDLRQAELVTAKLVTTLAAQPVAGRQALAASAGVAVFGQSGATTGDALMTAADTAMYQAKRSGSRYVVAGPDPER